MSDNLIAQVRALAEAQEAIPEGAQLEGTMYGTVDAAYFVQQASAFDFPALLARLERTQAVVDAARALRALSPTDKYGEYADDWLAARDALDAALGNLETNDGK